MGRVTAEPPDGAPRDLQAFDDHELIDLVRTGDERGFGELYRRHAPTALRAARARTRSAHEADDVVADVFDGIWRAIRNGKGPTTRFEPYLVAAIRNRARTIPTGVVGPPIDEHIAALATVDAEPDSGDNVARRAFAHLPSRERQILWLTAVEGRTSAEAASALSLTRRAATTLKYRAKRAFAEAYLAEYGAAGARKAACRDLCPKLSRHVRGTGTPTATQAVERHLAECQACERLVRELADVNATLRTVGPAAGLLIGANRVGRATRRVAASKIVLLTTAAGVVAFLPAAALLGGDPPTPGPTIVDEALPAPATATATATIIAGTDRGSTWSSRTESTATWPVEPGPVLAAVTSAPSIVSSPATTAPSTTLAATTTTTMVSALAAPPENDAASGVSLTADSAGVDVDVVVLPLVDAGLAIQGDGDELVIDVALTVALIATPPVEIVLPALPLPELLLPEGVIPELDVELPLPDLPGPELTLPD